MLQKDPARDIGSKIRAREAEEQAKQKLRQAVLLNDPKNVPKDGEGSCINRNSSAWRLSVLHVVHLEAR